MSINFDRNRTQVTFELLAGYSPQDPPAEKKRKLRNYVLTPGDLKQLEITLEEDAIDFFYNGLVSFIEGINAAESKRFSWAVIKLYYSIYYMLRATLASNGTAILREGKLFRLSLVAGSSPVDNGVSSTHKGTIIHYCTIFPNDKLLSNNIEGMTTYEWMLEAREIINYRSVTFKEPGNLNIWDKFVKGIDGGTIGELLCTLENDPNFVYCFQEEYAIVGIPIKCIRNTIDDFSRKGIIKRLNQTRIDYTRNLLNSSLCKLNIPTSIFIQ